MAYRVYCDTKKTTKKKNKKKNVTDVAKRNITQRKLIWAFAPRPHLRNFNV